MSFGPNPWLGILQGVQQGRENRRQQEIEAQERAIQQALQQATLEATQQRIAQDAEMHPHRVTKAGAAADRAVVDAGVAEQTADARARTPGVQLEAAERQLATQEQQQAAAEAALRDTLMQVRERNPDMTDEQVRDRAQAIVNDQFQDFDAQDLDRERTEALIDQSRAQAESMRAAARRQAEGQDLGSEVNKLLQDDDAMDILETKPTIEAIREVSAMGYDQATIRDVAGLVASAQPGPDHDPGDVQELIGQVEGSLGVAAARVPPELDDDGEVVTDGKERVAGLAESQEYNRAFAAYTRDPSRQNAARLNTAGEKLMERLQELIPEPESRRGAGARLMSGR